MYSPKYQSLIGPLSFYARKRVSQIAKSAFLRPTQKLIAPDGIHTHIGYAPLDYCENKPLLTFMEIEGNLNAINKYGCAPQKVKFIRQ
jgi:hypothetical protein